MDRLQSLRQAYDDLVRQRVHHAYWDHDWTCAVTTLSILGEVFDVAIAEQVLNAAVGMHGAGGYRAQCGLVEGALMFTGILGRVRGHTDDTVAEACYSFAEAFEDRFGSLLCRELRPEGFKPDNPPHLCEDLTRRAVLFAIAFITEELGGQKQQAEKGRLPNRDDVTPTEGGLTHLDDGGRVRMVGVGHKPATHRVAVAKGEVRMRPETLRLIAGSATAKEPTPSSSEEPTPSLPKEPAPSLPKERALSLSKGDVLTTAQIAGIMAAKRTHDLIPLCHPLPLTKIDIDFAIDEPGSRVEITAIVRCTGQTGVEMEALTAVSVAALTIYDMAKAVEKTMQIGQIRLISKTGGKSGDWRLRNTEWKEERGGED